MDIIIQKSELASKNSNFIDQVSAVIDNKINSRINTTLIGVIDSFDVATQTCSVSVIQPYKKSIDDGKNFILRDTNYKLFTDVPVVFPSGGGFTLTFPVKRGDECLLVFSMRSLEEWKQSNNGGVQITGSGKEFSTNDAIAIVGINPPRKVQNSLPTINADQPELRTNAGGIRLRMTDTGVEIDGNFYVDGKLEVTGDIIGGGDIKTQTGDIVAGTVSLKNHIHPAGIAVSTTGTAAAQTGATTAPTSPPTP